jgi:uncharacterized protein
MSLIQDIKNEQIAARKQGQKSASILTTLLGEAQMIGKNDGNRETTDSEVLAVVKKFIKNIQETIPHVTSDSQRENLNFELTVLSNLLPAQLQPDELQTIISQLIQSEHVTSAKEMGKVMAKLKALYDGRFDGRLASNLVKACLE